MRSKIKSLYLCPTSKFNHSIMRLNSLTTFRRKIMAHARRRECVLHSASMRWQITTTTSSFITMILVHIRIPLPMAFLIKAILFGSPITCSLTCHHSRSTNEDPTAISIVSPRTVFSRSRQKIMMQISPYLHHLFQARYSKSTTSYKSSLACCP